MKPLDAQTIRHQLDGLVAAYPEIGEDEILRGDMFEAETDLHRFLAGVEKTRRGAATYAAAIDLEIEELRARRDRFRRRDEAMRSLLFKMLQWAELSKVELVEATISIRRGTRRVIITDENAVPDAFCRIVRDPDRSKIREALLAFEHVAGAELSNPEPSLTVRIK